jgi:O-acetyl-ADP-ribose deacetylase (regulator of RNase III)
MIELTQGDILQADTEALVNTVNCVGVMGRGIALQFKKSFPENFKYYKVACDKKELKPGKMLIYNLNRLYNPRYVVNFPTKRHWKGKSRMADIEAGLKALVEELRKRNIQSIAIPPLGSGLGGLRWEDVKEKIKEAFQDLTDVRVILYEPKGAAPTRDYISKQKGWAQ